MLRYLLRSTIRAFEADYNSPIRKGARGERWVNDAMLAGLDQIDYRVLSDVILPLRGSTTQIDHVVLSRFGIFVIETKNMSGWIFGSPDQKMWTQVLKGGKKRRFQNPIFQNFAHIKAVQGALSVEQDRLHNLVVFVGDAIPKTPMPDRVAWGMQELGQLIGRRRQILFSPDEIRNFEDVLLKCALEKTKDVKRDHIRNVELLVERRTKPGQGPDNGNAPTEVCPKCGAAMVERVNRKTGDRFMGCSKFPKCRATRAMD